MEGGLKVQKLKSLKVAYCGMDRVVEMTPSFALWYPQICNLQSLISTLQSIKALPKQIIIFFEFLSKKDV